MRIVSLEASNFKRLKAVFIEPKGAVVEITGKNGAGKSSVLDAIWAALGGKDAAPPVPIRVGQEEARISLDLGEIKIIRTFTAKDDGAFTTKLVVESAEGARFPSPQGVLDALVGALTFDPLAFQRMPAKDQFATCRAFVPDFDFDNMEALNRGDFERRTEINRRIRDLKGQIAGMPEAPAVAEVDLAALEARFAEASTQNSQLEGRRARREAAISRIDDLQSQILTLTEEMNDLKRQVADAPALPDPVDMADVQQQLIDGRAQNAKAQVGKARQALTDELEAAEGEESKLSGNIEKRKADAAKAVAAAKMPVPGLDFGDGMVLLNGVPFEQASDAERLRASIAIAGAMNSRLKIVRVRDGSLLDDEAWAILQSYAAENDLQLWVETVQSGRSHAVVIEDGGVISNSQAESPPSEIL